MLTCTPYTSQLEILPDQVLRGGVFQNDFDITRTCTRIYLDSRNL